MSASRSRLPAPERLSLKMLRAAEMRGGPATTMYSPGVRLPKRYTPRSSVSAGLAVVANGLEPTRTKPSGSLVPCDVAVRASTRTCTPTTGSPDSSLTVPVMAPFFQTRTTMSAALSSAVSTTGCDGPPIRFLPDAPSA